MSYIATNIIRSIVSLKSYGIFSSAAIGQGLVFLKQKEVTNVKIVNSNILTANVADYFIVFKLDTSNYVSISCNCEQRGQCAHKSAVVSYVHENSQKLDFDYLVNTPDPIKVNYINSLSQVLSGMPTVDISAEEMKNYLQIFTLLVDNIIEVLDLEDNIDYYDLYFILFTKIKEISFPNKDINDIKKRFMDVFPKLVLSSSKNFLSSWARYLKRTVLDTLLQNINETVLLVDNESKALALIEFLKYTIGLVRSGLIYSVFDSSRYSVLNTYLYVLVLLNVKVMREYFKEEEYLKYFESNIYNQQIENVYISTLLEHNRDDLIIKYVAKTKNTFSLAKIVYYGIKNKNNEISLDEYEKNILTNFQSSPIIESFVYIHKFAKVELFTKIKDKLLAIAKKNDKYNYYEIEIYLDLDNGYKLAKEAGIFELDKHIKHFKYKYEDDLITYYQEQLVDHFIKVKSIGSKFMSAMAAIENLVKLKNGRYHAFSIYRLARMQIEEFASEGINYLYSYINNLEL